MHVYAFTTCTKKWMRISIEQKKRQSFSNIIFRLCRFTENATITFLIFVLPLLVPWFKKKALKSSKRSSAICTFATNVQEKTKCHRMFVIKELYELYELYEISRRGN